MTEKLPIVLLEDFFREIEETIFCIKIPWNSFWNNTIEHLFAKQKHLEIVLKSWFVEIFREIEEKCLEKF